MIINENYTRENIQKVLEYFKNIYQVNFNEEIIEQHLYCLGLLESFSKIGMNFVLIGNMATYLMCEKNLYLPNNIEIMVNKQDFINDYLKEANLLFSALDYKVVKEVDDYLLFEYTYKSNINDVVKIYLNVRLEEHIVYDVASIEINKPYILNENKIYRLKTPLAERLFTEALFNFTPQMLLGKRYSSDDFSLYTIKCLLDMYQLYNCLEDFEIVINNYYKIIKDYKLINERFKFEHFIREAFNNLINVYCQGNYRKEYYRLFISGIKEIQYFKINELVDEENIFRTTTYPLLVCSCIYQNINCFNVEVHKKKMMNFYNYSKVNLMKEKDQVSFNIICTAIEIFEDLQVISDIYK